MERRGGESGNRWAAVRNEAGVRASRLTAASDSPSEPAHPTVSRRMGRECLLGSSLLTVR